MIEMHSQMCLRRSGILFKGSAIMDSMEEGVEIALKWIQNSKASDSCVENGTCIVSKDRYTDLDQPYETELEEYYTAATCDITQHFRVFDDGTYI